MDLIYLETTYQQFMGFEAMSLSERSDVISVMANNIHDVCTNVTLVCHA